MCVTLAGVGWAPAGADDPAQRPSGKGGAGKVLIVSKGPKGTGANVVFRKRGSNRLVSLASAKSTKRVKLRAGTYQIRVSDSVTADGVTYHPVLKRSTITVAKGRSVKVRIKWKKLKPAAKFALVSGTDTTLSLRWSGSKVKKFALVRSTGDRAPRSRRQGTVVSTGRATEVVDSGLTPGTQYAYSLFVQKRAPGKRGKKAQWSDPVTLVTGTRGVDPVTGTPGPVYGLRPEGIVVAPGDSDRVAVSDGRAYVTLARSRPDPVLGGGVALPVSAELPGGYLGKIDQIGVDGRTVRLASAGLPDLFTQYALDTSFAATLDPGVTTNSSAENALAVPEALRSPEKQTSKPKNSARQETGSGTDCFELEALGLKASVDPSFGASGHLRVATVSDWGVPHAVELDTAATLKFGAALTLSATTAASCKIGLGDFAVQVTTTPVPMAMKWDAGAWVTTSGAVSVENVGFDSSLTVGAKARLGSGSYFEPVSDRTATLLEPRGKGEVSVNMGVGGSVVFGPGAGSEGAGAIAGIKGDLTLAEGTIAGKFGDDAMRYDRCFNFRMSSKASVGLTAEAWAGPFSASASFEILEGEKVWAQQYIPAGCESQNTGSSGTVRATLRWGNNDDMDIHVLDPYGDEVYYGNKIVDSGGQLDVDIIPDCDSAASQLANIENIFWPVDGAPSGTYEVWIEEFNDCGYVGPWTLVVQVDGQTVINESGTGNSAVFRFTV